MKFGMFFLAFPGIATPIREKYQLGTGKEKKLNQLKNCININMNVYIYDQITIQRTFDFSIFFIRSEKFIFRFTKIALILETRKRKFLFVSQNCKLQNITCPRIEFLGGVLRFCFKMAFVSVRFEHFLTTSD